MSESKPAVLLDCFTRGGLSVARSLARARVPFTAVAADRKNVVFRSRYVTNRWLAPDPTADATAYLASIQDLLEKTGPAVVIPLTDQATLALDSARDVLPQTATLGLPPKGAVQSVMDKSVNLGFAEELGIPHPRTIGWDEIRDPRALGAELGWPLVIKNPFPEAAPAGQHWPFRFQIVENAQELEHWLGVIEDCEPDPIFQEYVSGTAINICCFAARGKLLAVHQYVSRRRGSHAGVLREITELRPDLADYARLMMERVGWSGVAHVGFIQSFDGKDVWYMETNGRFWASTQGSVNAGWDMPYWHYRFFERGEIPQPGPLEIGSRTCHRPADLELLMRYLAGGRSPTFYSDPGKWRAVAAYLAAFGPGVHSDVWDWRDPLPGLADFARVLRSLWGSGLKRIGAGR